MVTPEPGSRLLAVLGPTNTGKTHLAVERMLGHATGMIGFPLRLLARENYDRAVRLKGGRAVALITGEEKILPARPRYFVCTVESMPLDREVDFLAVDEIQLAADAERGHIFTHRLFHARGREETMFLGSDTIRPLIRRLIPEARFITRPRFSRLGYTGSKKITRLPPRSAVIAFSVPEVYALAEVMRRQRGGTAVVLGALSPRTRNAQVAMYQAGEVDYLVATDAIGMGLNMEVNHVAFSSLTKFDGLISRRLTAPEVAQIAGRAGRYMSDGTFGTTAGLGPIEPEIVEAVENHRFDPLDSVFWRNASLDFSSPAALLKSLEAGPPAAALVRARDGDDHLALSGLAKDPEIKRLAANPEAVRLLWEVCQIPDFRKIMSDAHTRLLARIYRYLRAAEARLPEDWAAAQIARLDRTDGDIDTLTARIASIRTWTYVSYRADWVRDPAHWQQRTRAIEDRLSDALNQRLTQRFVDRRATVLVQRMRGRERLVGAVAKSGEVVVEGEYVGRLEGFRFIPDEAAERHDARALTNAARRALRGEIAVRVRRFADEGDAAFALGVDGRLLWRGVPVARLRAGNDILTPKVEPLPSDLLEPALRETMRRRLAAWLESHIAAQLEPLFRARDCDLSGAARGLVFQLSEGLGSVGRRPVADQLRALTAGDRKALTRLGIRLGQELIYMPALLKPAAVEIRALLWAVYHDFDDPPAPPGRVSAPLDESLPAGFYAAVGYPPAGTRAVRADRLEKLAAAARKLSRQGPFMATPALASLVECPPGELAGVLAALGYRAVQDQTGVSFTRERHRRHKGRAKRKREADAHADSPFAKLRGLLIAR